MSDDYDDGGGTKGRRWSREPRRFVSRVAELHRERSHDPANRSDRYSDENSVVRATRQLVRATWALAIIGVLTFLAAIGAAVLNWRESGAQVSIMSGQLNEMIDEQRPWVSGKMKILEPLTWDKRGSPVFKVHLAVENFGHNPARDVRYWFDLTPSGWPPGKIPEERQQDHCGVSKKYFVNASIMLHGDKLDFDITRAMSDQDLRLARVSKGLFVLFVGCIGYDLVGGGHRGTGFCYNLTDLRAGGPFLDPALGNVPIAAIDPIPYPPPLYDCNYAS